jgi:hypothetical protein
MFNVIIFIAGLIILTRLLGYPKKKQPKPGTIRRMEPPIQRYLLTDGSVVEVGGRCNLCGEPYVGLAMDCRCTNYGR